MEKEIIKKWDANKDRLKNYFSATPQLEYADYATIVKHIFEYVINDPADEYHNFDTTKIVVVDHGDYQGTQIFLVPRNRYQPDVGDYIITDTYYGSCSGCDTLQSIQDYEEGIPTKEQVDSYMTLALHLVQKMRWLDTIEYD